jgi:DNA replication protein DnaC
MTDSTSKYNAQVSSSILGGIGDNNTNIFNIQSQPAQPTPHRLPTDIGDFTGRKDYIAQIEAILTLGKIVTISGIPGVGKSALAIRVAHRLKDRFPDAQIHVNLDGHLFTTIRDRWFDLVLHSQRLLAAGDLRCCHDLILFPEIDLPSEL